MTRRGAAGWLVAALATQAACASPEAVRSRGGGPGADIMNRGDPVMFHAGAEPYYRTPCVTKPVECTGPPAQFDKSSKPD